MAISFKHRYKSDSLIGEGAVKFRPYTVTKPLPQLATPQNVTADGTVVSWDEVENATSYAVLADGNEIGTVEEIGYNLTFDNSITPYVNGKPGTSGMKLHNGDTISVSWQYFWLKVNGKDYEGYGETITITDSNINLSEGAYSSDFDAASLTINFVDTSVVHVSVDLTTLAGWEALSSGSHNIQIVAKANGFKDSAPSAAVSVEKASANMLTDSGGNILQDSNGNNLEFTEV